MAQSSTHFEFFLLTVFLASMSFMARGHGFVRFFGKTSRHQNHVPHGLRGVLCFSLLRLLLFDLDVHTGSIQVAVAKCGRVAAVGDLHIRQEERYTGKST